MSLLAAGPAWAAADPSGGTIRPGGDIADENCEEFSSLGPLDIELTGIPDPVVAGEWAEFTYRITNTYDYPVDHLYTFVALGAYDTIDGADIATRGQWFVRGAWRDLDRADDTDEYFGRTGALAPGESAEARMRVTVDASAPERALGTAGMMGTFADDATGVCESTVTDMEFDVAAELS
ncbi:hypothetical protein [Streptomyces sp. SBT349]|uniref:hypothetical protein n=1 Tax=Streptomyces sp. SBT349 TaxID=1580539 RepID=UPI00131BD6BC|nr:hypothetical protein [Streptomyces sp. SBT349]